MKKNVVMNSDNIQRERRNEFKVRSGVTIAVRNRSLTIIENGKNDSKSAEVFFSRKWLIEL